MALACYFRLYAALRPNPEWVQHIIEVVQICSEVVLPQLWPQQACCLLQYHAACPCALSLNEAVKGTRGHAIALQNAGSEGEKQVSPGTRIKNECHESCL